MGLAEHQHTVQAFAPYAAEEAFAGGILLGGTIRRPQHRDAARLRHPAERPSVLAVVVAEEVPWPLAEARRLAQLLGDPGVGGVPCDPYMDLYLLLSPSAV